MLHGLVDVLTRPLETYVTALATRAAEEAADDQVRAIVTRQVIDYVAPRAALVVVRPTWARASTRLPTMTPSTNTMQAMIEPPKNR